MYRRQRYNGLPVNDFTVNRDSAQYPGLLAWWPSQRSRVGNRLIDASGNGRNATYPGGSNDPSVVSDPVRGTAFSFDGTADYINVTSVNIPSQFGSLSFRCKANISAQTDIVSAGTGGNDFRIFIDPSGTDIVGFFIGAEYRIFSSTLDPVNGAWNLYTVTWGSAGTTVYLNGSSLGNNSTPPGAWSQTGLTLGRGTGGGNYYNGLLDDIRLYNRPLSAGEVRAMYENPWDLYGLVDERASLDALPTIIDPSASSMPLPYILRERHLPRARYQFMYYNPQREPVGLLSGHGAAHYTTSADNNGSGFSMELVRQADSKMVRDGGFIVASRKVDGCPWRYQETYLLASQPKSVAPLGTTFHDIEGDSYTKWLTSENRRFIGLLESVSGSYVTDTPADNALKYFISRNLAAGAGNSSTTRGRDLGIWSGLTVAKDQGLGPSIDYNASLKPLSTAIKDIVGLAELDDTKPCRLFVYVRPKTFVPKLTFEVVTVVGTLPSAAHPKRKRGALGVYRGFDSASPLLLGTMFGNVSQIETEHDLREGWNSVVGTYNSKTALTRITDTRLAADFPNAFGEVYLDAANSGLEVDAKVELRAKLLEGRPRYTHKLTLAESAYTVYEKDFFQGDVAIVCLDDGSRVEAEITGAAHVIDPDGLPTVQVRCEQILPMLF